MAYSSSNVLSISSINTMPTPHVNSDHLHQSPAPEFSPPVASLPPSYFQKIVAEVVGTYIFVFAGCGAAIVNREKELTVVGMAMVPGLALMAMIYAVGHISGAHFNPAVTVAFAAARKLTLIQVPIYILSQICGSTLACLTLRVLFRGEEDTILPLMLTQYTKISDVEAIVWELIITFILMLTISGVTSDDRTNNDLCGVAIGGALSFLILIAGPITGASMNPARSLGPAIVSSHFKNQWVYVVAPVVGAIAASLIYSLLRTSKPGKHTKAIYNDLYLSQEV